MIAPTVKLENGTANSTKVRVSKEADFKETFYEKPVMVAEGENVELINNGGFEYIASNTPAGWGGIQGIWGGQLGEKAMMVEDAPEGKQAIRFKNDTNTHVLQGLTKIVPGTEYELSVWCKRNTAKTVTSVHLMTYYLDPEDGMQTEYANGRIGFNFNDAPVGVWTQKTMKFTTPEDCFSVTVLARLMGEGDVSYDGVSLIGKVKESSSDVNQSMQEYQPVPEGAENLFADPSAENNAFEYVPQGSENEGIWFSREKRYEGLYSISDEVARTGKYSVHCEGIGELVWFGQQVPVKPNKIYQIAVWVYMKPGSETRLAFQCDAFKGPKHIAEDYIDAGQQGVYTEIPMVSNKWHRVQGTIQTYPGTTHYAVLFRGGSTYYDMYFDDFEMYELGDVIIPKIRTFEPDEVFYYADRKGEGHAKLTTPIDKYSDITKYPVRYRLLDGETILKEEISTLDENGEGIFRYDLDLLSEKKKEYKVEAALLGEDGTPIEEPYQRIIYKYDRPTMIDELQRFRDSGGQVVNYVLAQGSVEEVMWRCPDANLTVGRLIGSGRTSFDEKIDIAEQAGMKFTITLYNHNDITKPEIYKSVEETVKEYKDEPNLLAWYLWEEPGFDDSITLDENLRIGAKLIRDLDPKHPIGSVISEQAYYERLSTYNDYLDLDCYPAQVVGISRPQYIADNVKRAVEETDWQKPISIMNQAFEWFGYKPTWNELRNFIYQSFFEGAAGFSFHAFGRDADHRGDYMGVILDDEIWEEMEKAGWEYDFMFDHFVNMKYPFFNQNWDDNIRWRTVVVDGDIYAIILNMKEDQSFNVEIPLADYTGKVKFSGAKAELLAGGEKKTVSVSGNTFKTKVEPFAAYLYKITPNSPVDFSSVKPTRFRDLSRHQWAREAITALDEKGIVNDRSAVAFGPAQDITRGDFAMFLVRTLGLTSDSTENFADVKPDRDYTKELAIGKALGILNGVGDNKFNPDATITRQDMMTMIGRGMKLAGEADLSAFSDKAAIADYALPHVRAMIASGLVKGNADGTINPRGNTTRAEAAVIMQRILNQ